MATDQDSGDTSAGEYRAVFEASPNAILVVDGDTGAIRAANDTASTLFSRGRGQLRQQSLAELSPQTEDEQQLRRRAVETGQAQAEWRLETDDGPRWLGVTVERADDDTGRLFVFCRIVTEQREHERQLEENNAILTQLTGTTDEVFWLFDDSFSELLFINDAYEDVWGRSIADLKASALDFIEGVHPEDRDIVQGAVAQLQSGETTKHEYRVNPGEEFERWVWVRGEPIIGEDGTVERVAGFARDITERKERERTLERSERQFEAVFNDPQVLVGLLDTDGRIQRVNETAFGYVDASRAEIEGKPFAETAWWSHDEDLQEQIEELLDQAAAGEYVEFEAEHPLPDGGEINVEGTVRPVTDDEGTVRSLIVSSRDITERKERERQLAESNERLEKFAYVASHDLQEPLRTISNYIELIEDEYADDLDEEAERFIDTVVTGSKRMQSMINGLLDYSRVTTRGEEFESVDTEAVVGGRGQRPRSDARRTGRERRVRRPTHCRGRPQSTPAGVPESHQKRGRALRRSVVYHRDSRLGHRRYVPIRGRGRRPRNRVE